MDIDTPTVRASHYERIVIHDDFTKECLEAMRERWPLDADRVSEFNTYNGSRFGLVFRALTKSERENIEFISTTVCWRTKSGELGFMIAISDKYPNEN